MLYADVFSRRTTVYIHQCVSLFDLCVFAFYLVFLCTLLLREAFFSSSQLMVAEMGGRAPKKQLRETARKRSAEL